MKRILITGMSGTGKTSVIRELAARGYQAHDLDTPEWSHWIDANESDKLTPSHGRDWVWREDRVRKLLSETKADILFISGCAENMKQLFPLIETIILLTAPLETIVERLQARVPGNYGHNAEERERVIELISTLEPLLRKRADYEVDTRKSAQETADEILRICEGTGD